MQRVCKMKTTKFQTKVSVFWAGIGMSVMALAYWFTSTQSIFVEAFNQSGVGEFLAWCLLLLGSAMAYTALRPMRSIRLRLMAASAVLAFFTFLMFVQTGNVTWPSLSILVLSCELIHLMKVEICPNARKKLRMERRDETAIGT